MRTAPTDLATPARIRNAAVRLFARRGFGIGLRAIADEAGVSLGLIRHHFGSKEGLRQACDEYVLAELQHAQAEQAESEDMAASMLDNLASVDRYRPLVDYIVQALLAGGELARTVVERSVADAETYLERGVERGTIRASIDPAARARHVVMAKFGTMLLERILDDDPAAAWSAMVERHTLPALELYTHGLLTDTTLLDAYLAYRKDPR